VHKDKGYWQVTINTKPLPKFCITEKYSSLLHSPEVSREEKNQFKKYLFSGKWLQHMLSQRTETLQKITKYLVKMQLPFFENEAAIEPLSLREVAKEISLHESTVARAIKDKYLSCPHGVFPLRKFFSNSLRAPSGKKVSTQSAKEILRKMLENEDKIAPLSDKALAEKLSQQGIICARRTIAKYRKQLQKPKASQRRYFIKGKTLKQS
jgi:RNA polymerase sigma-54 factor